MNARAEYQAETSKEIRSVTITRQPASFSVIINAERTYLFDPSGRPVALVLQGRYFARSLGGDLKEKSWDGTRSLFERFVRDIASEEKTRIMRTLRTDINDARNSIETGSVLPEIIDALAPSLKQADVTTYLAQLVKRIDSLPTEEGVFKNLYKPISILPPDQYFTIVLQVTEGCAWNRCTFCDFYRDRPFRIRPLPELREHFDKVSTFLGEGRRLRNSIFMGDANAFILKTPVLLTILEEIKSRFPEQTGPQGQGIASFADVRAVITKTPDELRALKEAGLRRLYIGMETGSDELRQLVRKQDTAAHLQQAVERLKDAGLSVGVILMLGIGGREMERAHIEKTHRVLDSLRLDADDIVFFSPFQPPEETEYESVAKKNGWNALDPTEIERQHAVLRGFLKQSASANVRQGVYDIREFIY